MIEQWNGATWSLTAGPANAVAYGGFFGVTCVSIADCWAVGTTLLGQGGQPAGTLAAHWNGTAWSAVSTPNPAGATGAVLQGVTCVSTSDCWAVGYTTTAAGGNESTLLVEQWNGSAWSIVPAAPSGQTYDELVGVDCSGPADCWAVGSAGPNQEKSTFLPIFPGAQDDQGLIEHWNGSAWSIVPSYQATAPERRLPEQRHLRDRHGLLGGRFDDEQLGQGRDDAGGTLERLVMVGRRHGDTVRRRRCAPR